MAGPTTIARLLERYTLEWMTRPGVVGTAESIHRGKPCLMVLVEKKTPALAKAFPPEIEGHRVVLREVGRVQKRSMKVRK